MLCYKHQQPNLTFRCHHFWFYFFYFSGLATFANRPWNASDSLRPLLDFAASHVPKSKHRETPLFILATAGMRLLPQAKQTAILNDIRTKIPKRYDFHLAPSQVEVISGKQEGT